MLNQKTAPHDSWGSDQGPQCSNSSQGKEPQFQLKVLWVVQSNQRPPLSTTPPATPFALQQNSYQRAGEIAQWGKALDQQPGFNSSELTWQKESSDSHGLYSDLHGYVVAHVCTHKHTYRNKCKNQMFLKSIWG